MLWLDYTAFICLRFINSSALDEMTTISQWVGVGGFSKVVATFNHVGRSFNIFMATTGGVFVSPSFRIWGYVLYVEHISCVITNCGQHQWAIPSLFSIAHDAFMEENITRKLPSLSPILTRIVCFRTVTPVLIQLWLWNDAQSLTWYRRGALLFFKVIYQISRSHGTKNHQFWPELSISGLYLPF